MKTKKKDVANKLPQNIHKIAYELKIVLEQTIDEEQMFSCLAAEDRSTILYEKSKSKKKKEKKNVK